MNTYTFQIGTKTHKVQAASEGDALKWANARLVPTLSGFYAWQGSGTAFRATFGAWD
jgi:hypothetical protein